MDVLARKIFSDWEVKLAKAGDPWMGGPHRLGKGPRWDPTLAKRLCSRAKQCTPNLHWEATAEEIIKSYSFHLEGITELKPLILQVRKLRRRGIKWLYCTASKLFGDIQGKRKWNEVKLIPELDCTPLLFLKTYYPNKETNKEANEKPKTTTKKDKKKKVLEGKRQKWLNYIFWNCPYIDQISGDRIKGKEVISAANFLNIVSVPQCSAVIF